MASYYPEPYWNDVAKRIAARTNARVIAGDDEPYYQYKRQQFLKLLHVIPFADKTVLEIGSGPGGNLAAVYNQHPKALYGVDISEEMIELSKQLLSGKNIQLQKINGVSLPFATNYFDVSFTSTVLQHITDEAMLEDLINEMCRVTTNDIYIFERIESRIKGTELCAGRPTHYYETLFSKHQFVLGKTTFLNIHISYFVSGVIRKLFNPRTKKEGEPISTISRILQKSTLPVTAALDPLLKRKRELAMLHFRKG